MVKAFKYRIYPNKSQEILLSKTFGCVRLIWNANVASFNSYDKEDNPKPNIIQKSDLIRCGWRKNDLTLSDRTFVCDSCGLILDRDLNAALNIKRVGFDILYNRTLRDEVTSPCEASIIK